MRFLRNLYFKKTVLGYYQRCTTGEEINQEQLDNDVKSISERWIQKVSKNCTFIDPSEFKSVDNEGLFLVLIVDVGEKVTAVIMALSGNRRACPAEEACQ
jgi:hypothetical protein